MARAANQKLKCLYLWQFLLQNTDEEHPATIPQMIEYWPGTISPPSAKVSTMTSKPCVSAAWMWSTARPRAAATM